MPVQPEGILKSAKEQPQDFESQLKDLTEKLEKSQREGLEREDVITVVSRVFEHSITDGLSMAQKLRLTPDEMKATIATETFRDKHTAVDDVLNSLCQKHGKQPIPLGHDRTPEEVATKAWIGTVDELFAPLLAARELKFKKIPGEEIGNELVEYFLTKVKRAYEHSYYSGPVLDELIAIPQVGLTKEILYKHHPILRESTITESVLQSICADEHIPFEETKTKLKDARYLLPDGVIQLEQKAAEKVLIGDLEKQLGSTGEVFLNHDTGKYEIKMYEQEKKEEKKEKKTERKEEPSVYKTIDHLQELLEEGAKPENILYSLTGLDTKSAWAWREYLYNNHNIQDHELLESITGLDSSDAWAWRNSFPDQGRTTFGIEGLDSPEAWELREKLYKEGLNPNLLAKTLVGLDSPKAWEWRKRLMEIAKNDSMLQSVAGLDSERSWQWRKDVMKYAGATDQGIALSLVGVDSAEAWDMRHKKRGNQWTEDFANSLTGLDTITATYFRRQMMNKIYTDVIANTLVGMDSNQAWDTREELLQAGVSLEALGESVIGVEQPQAWVDREHLFKVNVPKNEFAIVAMILKNQKLRKEKAWVESYEEKPEKKEKTEDEELDELEKRLEKGDDPSEIFELTAGIDSERAWKLRKDLHMDMGMEVSNSSKLNGMAFLNSNEAWEWRKNLIIQSNDDHAKLASITGLDDERAWEVRNNPDMRREENYCAIAESLMGLDTDEAWNLRRALLKSVKSLESPEKKDELINSLILSTTGLHDDNAKEFRDRIIEGRAVPTEILEESETEQPLQAYKRLLRERHAQIQAPTRWSMFEEEKLKELNLVHHPTLDGIDEYFKAHRPIQIPLEDEKFNLSRKGSRATLTLVSKTIQDLPEAFLNTIAAKRDRNPEMLAKLLFEKIYPDTVKPKKEVGLTTRIASFFGMGPRPEATDIQSSLHRNHVTTLEGGGETELNDTRSIVEFRNAIDELLVTDVYGAYDDTTGQWRTAQFPVAKPRSEPMRQTTGTISDVKGLTEIALPKPVSASLIEGRVKGVLANGTEVTLETSSDHLGIAVAKNKPGVERILYSIEYETAPRPMQDVSEREYAAFRKRFTVAEGKENKEKSDLAKALPDLPENIVQHILTPEFMSLSPKEKVQDIERYVRSVGYYDTKNEETQAAKKGKPLGDKFFLAEMRAEELKAANTPGLEGKKFAGVCADYATITCALLRKAGFLSGVVAGMHPEGTKAMVRDSHATAFVVWPTPEYENQVVIVDGTPASADPAFAFVEGKTIEEREETAHVEAKEAVEKAKKELNEIGNVLKSKDAEAIKKLSNGKLERALNTILHHEVTELHTDILKEMLNVYWYGGLNKLEGIQSDLEMRKAMEDILDARRLTLAKEGKARKTGAGTELFEAMQDFLRKYKKATGDRDSASSLDALERIGGIAKDALQPTEKQALDVIVTYLRAKKVG